MLYRCVKRLKKTEGVRATDGYDFLQEKISFRPKYLLQVSDCQIFASQKKSPRIHNQTFEPTNTSENDEDMASNMWYRKYHELDPLTP